MFIITPDRHEMASLKDICAKTIFDHLLLDAKRKLQQDYRAIPKKIYGITTSRITKKQLNSAGIKTKETWKQDKRQAQVKKLVKFFSQYDNSPTLFSYLLDWFIKNPHSPLYCLRSWESSAYIARELFDSKNMYLKYPNFPILESIINFFPSQMKNTIHPDYSFSDNPTVAELKQKLIGYILCGTNPTKALTVDIDPENDEEAELIYFLFNYNCWIKNNKNVWQHFKCYFESYSNNREYYKKVLIGFFKQPLSLSLKKNILHSISSYSNSPKLNNIVLSNMYIDKNLISCCCPLHKAIKKLNDITFTDLITLNKFDVNVRYKNKTPVNLLLSRAKNIFKQNELGMLQLLQEEGAHFDNNDQQIIQNNLNYFKQSQRSLLTDPYYCGKYSGTIGILEKILNNISENLNSN